MNHTLKSWKVPPPQVYISEVSIDHFSHTSKTFQLKSAIQTAFQNVRNFTYLGVLLNNRGTVSEEINKRIMTGSKAYYANNHLLKSTLLSRSTKMKFYRTLIIP
jgi:hypothetical protein